MTRHDTEDPEPAPATRDYPVTVGGKPAGSVRLPQRSRRQQGRMEHKNPIFVESGRRGARKRWGAPRVVRLDRLTTEQRRLVLAWVEAAERPQAPEPA